MTLTTDTLADLRRAICREPAEDHLRGVFADALDDAGDHEWAEFVRVQCELAAMRGRFAKAKCHIAPLTPKCKCDGCHLQRRESALLAALEPRLRRGEKCEACKDNIWGSVDATLVMNCPTCYGRGWLGVLGERTPPDAVENGADVGDLWLIPATFTRGLVSAITCTMEWWEEHGRAAWKEWPLTDIDFSTHRPWQHRSGKWNCHGADDRAAVDGQDHAWIPSPIYDLMWKLDRNGACGGYPTPAAARAALSAACLAWEAGKG